ncbi:MAG: alkylhalidase [Planctomycetaceae bacterium]|nr:alkylhalidase [Planctomycetaceae bacterium]
MTVRSPVLDFDVVVAGGGPAGATAAGLLAEHGHSVLIVERESIPRLHVGESLIPAANEVLDRLGMIDQMLASPFPKKYSVQFITESGRESEPFYFDGFESTGLGHTWQVVRSDFDRMLVDNARRLGATVMSQTKLRVPHGQAGSFRELELQASDGPPIRVSNRVFVDATGQSALIGSTLGLKRNDPALKNATVWTHFRGARRDSGRDAGATIILHSRDMKSWFWYIPLPDNIVSVGCTGRLDYMFQRGNSSAEEIFERELQRCESLQTRLATAERVEPYRATKDFSYRCRPGSGDGWVMIGDAYGFIDPVYSSGAFLALKSGEMAADSIHESLITGDVSAKTLGRWQPTYDAGVENFRQLVYAFYDMDFNFGRFLTQFPEHRGGITDILVGNVFKAGLEAIFHDIAIAPSA